MASDNRILFVEDPRALGRFYEDLLLMDPPAESTINNRLQLTYRYSGGTLQLRQSASPLRSKIETPLRWRLPEGVSVAQTAATLEAAGYPVTTGTSVQGLEYLEVNDPVGIPWRLVAYTK